MKFEQFYSSSKGNLYQVTTNNGKRLLIECGVPWRLLQKALDYNLGGIEGVLCSHEHNDHSKAIKDILKAGINIYASLGTIDSLGISGHRKVNVLESTRTFSSSATLRMDFQVYAFNLNHDSAEPLGFVIKCDNEYLLYACDTAFIKQRFKIPFNIIAIECSYDKEILQERLDTGKINEELAKRLLNCHMEKQTAIKYLKEFCDLSRCSEIHLLHMSENTTDKEKTRQEIEDKFFVKTIIK